VVVTVGSGRSSSLLQATRAALDTTAITIAARSVGQRSVGQDVRGTRSTVVLTAGRYVASWAAWVSNPAPWD
jgi:hypothetical protein